MGNQSVQIDHVESKPPKYKQVGCSRVAMGLKNLWARKVLGPKNAMRFWKVLYLALIIWGGVYSGAWA